jgi:hypothetical protein
MASKAKRRIVRRGSSKAGRPKKAGARYPGGQLRPPTPNEVVVKQRREMLGDASLDIALASDALDLAHARGWITDVQHRAARTLGKLYHQARIGGPRMGSGALHEVQPALQIDARSFAIMSDDEVEELWDKVFSDEGEATPEDRAETALALWGKIMGSLDQAVQSEMFAVCIAGSWPQWMVYEARGKPVPPTWEVRRTRLFLGLAKVRDVARKPRPHVVPPSQPHPLRKHNRRARMVEERIIYVDEGGDTVPIVSEHGLPFEVARLTRRAS